MTDNGEGAAHFENLSRLAHDEVQAVLAALPKKIRTRVEAVPVFCEPFPDAEDVASGIGKNHCSYCPAR